MSVSYLLPEACPGLGFVDLDKHRGCTPVTEAAAKVSIVGFAQLAGALHHLGKPVLRQLVDFGEELLREFSRLGVVGLERLLCDPSNRQSKAANPERRSKLTKRSYLGDQLDGRHKNEGTRTTYL